MKKIMLPFCLLFTLICIGQVNQLPVANAGADMNLSYDLQNCRTNPTQVTLDGSQSTDAGGTIVSFLWMGVGRILNAEQAITQISDLSLGRHDFILKVTDNHGSTDMDTVVITVVSMMNRP